MQFQFNFPGSAFGFSLIQAADATAAKLLLGIVGGLDYRGTWDASTNSPTLASGVGSAGDFYKVSVAGTTNIDGITAWDAGDTILFEGTTWQKLDGGSVQTATSLALGGATIGTNSFAVTGTALFNGAITLGAASNLGTPSALVGTNITGTAAGLTAGTASAVAIGGITGLGTGVATALAINIGSAGAFLVNGGVLGTPSSGTVTNLTGTMTGVSIAAGSSNTLAASTLALGATSTAATPGLSIGNANTGFYSTSSGVNLAASVGGTIRADYNITQTNAWNLNSALFLQGGVTATGSLHVGVNSTIDFTSNGSITAPANGTYLFNLNAQTASQGFQLSASSTNGLMQVGTNTGSANSLGGIQAATGAFGGATIGGNALAWTGTAVGSGNLTIGSGGTGSTNIGVIINGGSGANGDPYVAFQSNSAVKGYIGTVAGVTGVAQPGLIMNASVSNGKIYLLSNLASTTLGTAANSTPAANTLNIGESGSGTNIAAGSGTILSGLSTGNATNPDLIFQIGVKVGSGTGGATATEAFRLKGETGNLAFSIATAGITLKQGANGRVGTFVANGVTPVVVTNSSVAISDAIIISLNTGSGTVGTSAPVVTAISAGTSFTTQALALDASTYNYAIIKNAA